MKKIIIFLSVFLYALIIEPKSVSHRGVVNDIKIIDNKIYSVSNDNTLKIWDKNLSLITTVYEKQNENYGNLYTLASNGKYILTAGIVGNDNAVFIHRKGDLKTVKLLRHDFNAVNKLKFSPDKKILVVVAGDGLYFYDENFRFLYGKNFYDYNEKYRAIYDIVFLNNHEVAFVDWDGFVIVYDIKNKSIVKTKRLNTRLQSIDLIKNRLYVGGYDGYLYVFDENLKLLKKISMPSFEILKITHYKNYVAVAGGNGGFALLKNDNVVFKKNTGFSKAIAINKDDIFVADGEKILHYKFDKPQNKTKTIILKPSFVKFDSPVFNLNYRDIYINFIGTHENSKRHAIGDNYYTYEITTTKLLDDTLMVYKLNGNTKEQVGKFIRTNSSGYRHRAVLWYKHYIISGGSYGYVLVYDVKSKSRVAKLTGIKDHVLDIALKGDILAVLDETGDIRLYDLSKIMPEIAPYLTVTLYKDNSFLLRSGSYFYTNDINKAVCLRPTKLSLIKTSCKPNRGIIRKIILSKKPFEKKVETVDLTSGIPMAVDVNINWIFNTSKYIILGDLTYYALNKKTKKLKAVKLPPRYISAVLEKDGFVYILLRWGNVYKFDENLNFIAKTNFDPDIFGKSSRFLSVYKKKYIASRYKDKIWIFDMDLNPKYKIPVPVKDLYYWTFIGDVLYLKINNKLIKIDFKNKKSKSIDIELVKLKTPQNKLIVDMKKYYILDKDLRKKPLGLSGTFYDFYNGKRYFYALSDDEIVKFLDGKKMESARVKEEIDSLAGAAEIGDEVAFVSHHKLKTYDFKTKKTELLTQPAVRLFDMFVEGDYVVAEGNKFIYVYKNLKLIKKLRRDYAYIYAVKNNKIYLISSNGNKYAVDLRNFKTAEVTKIPEMKKPSAVYSGTDGYIYYKSFAAKAKEKIYKLYETDKYIIAWGKNNNLYVYDKKLNLIKKIVLDKRVSALYVTDDGYLYYAVYDNVFVYGV
ncbi:MAG: hypothetical protein GXO01_03200 [Epsilonproteobacteria bacterium]|nr:hypothetical protein [Campylobacterota bacterium]